MKNIGIMIRTKFGEIPLAFDEDQEKDLVIDVNKALSLDKSEDFLVVKCQGKYIFICPMREIIYFLRINLKEIENES